MQGRIKVLKDVDKSNILPMTHAKAVYVDEKNTLDKTLNNIESQIIQQRKTYAELKELIENEQLVPGVQYVLTDYRTKYIQPTTEVIKEMDVEELVLTASSENTFEPIVFSTKYPSDTIWYDFNDVLCEDGTTPRNGFILRRYDPISGNDAPQDWRTMLWARYKPDTLKYIVGTNVYEYRIWTNGTPVDLNRIYKADNKLWMARNTNTPTSPTDTNVFFEVYPDIDTPLLINEKTKWGDGIELMRGELVEVPTFGESCRKNKIETMINNELHNNIFFNKCSRNELGECYNNTFGVGCNGHVLGSSSRENILNECFSNVISNTCFQNIILKSCSYNNFDNYCSGNILLNNCIQNSFSIRCYDNILTSSCQRNSFGNGCYNNKFQHNTYYNSFSNDCYSNSFGNDSVSNSFGNGCFNNSFGKNFVLNNLGNATTQSIFGEGCQRNTFGNSNNNNKFGNNCSNNTFFNDCDNNTFGDSFQCNVVKKLVSKNLSSFSNELTSELVTVTFELDINNKYTYWFLGTDSMIIKKIP